MIKDIGIATTGNIVCIHKMKPIGDAYKIMKDFPSRHLPVVDDDNAIIGIVSDRDVKRAMRKIRIMGWSALDVEPQFNPEDLVLEFMSWPVQAIDKSKSVVEAAELMLEKKISCLIVTSEKNAVGIVTSDDLLKVLIEEHKSVTHIVKDSIAGLILKSPIGSIAQMLSNIGI